MIGISQVGYLPRQTKRAVIELDRQDDASEPVKLYEERLTGERKLVKSAAPKPWGQFLRFKYATFDFSEVQEQGIYTLEYGVQKAGPFQIAERVYD